MQRQVECAKNYCDCGLGQDCRDELSQDCRDESSQDCRNESSERKHCDGRDYSEEYYKTINALKIKMVSDEKNIDLYMHLAGARYKDNEEKARSGRVHDSTLDNLGL